MAQTQGTSILELVRVLEGVQAAGQVIHSGRDVEGSLLSTIDMMMRPIALVFQRTY